MKKIIVATLAATTLLMTTACEVPEEDNKPGALRATTGAKADAGTKPTKAKPTKAKPTKAKTPEGPKETAGQANARASAEDYLGYDAFSRTGLIDQLKYEGYTLQEATYGADAVNANWMEQAARAAKDYLDYDSFSHSGLVEQLKYEGYTPQQAEYGVKKAGL